MNFRFSLLLLALLVSTGNAGDYASGPVSYSLNLSQSYSSYALTERDKLWSTSLVENLNYDGEVIHFVQTTLSLSVNDVDVVGFVYHAVEAPDYFYVSKGDAMLKLGDKSPYSPGTGGFSMHANSLRKFISCLNCLNGGVPFFDWTSLFTFSRIGNGTVSWKGTDFSRI